MQVVEFSASEPNATDGPFPIAWFRFHPNADLESKGMLSCVLQQPRCSGFVLLKLICPEDRMEELGDDHIVANIDIAFCGVEGWLL